MQLLPPKQRAVLILRDVLGWRAREVAELLDDTVPAVNSALQRARSTMTREQTSQTLARTHAPASRADEQRVVRMFREAWARVDVPGIVALLTDDALLTMPPVAMELIGLEQIADFFATAPAGGQLDRIELIEARANGQPALVSYADEDGSGTGRAYGVIVLALRGSRISGFTGFPNDLELFEQLGLPLSRARETTRSDAVVAQRAARVRSDSTRARAEIIGPSAGTAGATRARPIVSPVSTNIDSKPPRRKYVSCQNDVPPRSRR